MKKKRIKKISAAKLETKNIFLFKKLVTFKIFPREISSL